MNDTKVVRAKFKCWSVYCNRDKEQNVSREVIALGAVYGPGNEEWAKYTPSGHVTLTIDNPNCWGYFQEGKEYLLDFTTYWNPAVQDPEIS